MANSEGTRPIRVGKRGERLRESRSMVMIQSWDCDVSMARRNGGKENERREREGRMNLTGRGNLRSKGGDATFYFLRCLLPLSPLSAGSTRSKFGKKTVGIV